MLPSAIRSKAILRGVVRCVSHRDGQDAHAPRQTGIATFPECLAANRCPSRLKTANLGPTASPKAADGLRYAARAWGLLHGRAFAAEPVAVVSPVHAGGRLDASYIVQSQLS